MGVRAILGWGWKGGGWMMEGGEEWDERGKEGCQLDGHGEVGSGRWILGL